jgi:hypothetical protein
MTGLSEHNGSHTKEIRATSNQQDGQKEISREREGGEREVRERERERERERDRGERTDMVVGSRSNL